MSDFDWDDENRAHVGAHGVTPEEAEQVFENDPFDLEFQTVGDEERVLQVGVTNLGRFLLVASTWRDERLRVVTAFPASPGFQKLYLREKGGTYGDRRKRAKNPKIQE